MSADGVRALAERRPELIVRYVGEGGQVLNLGLDAPAAAEEAASLVYGQVLEQLLSSLRLRDMNAIAGALGRKTGHRRKASARQALADASLAEVLPHAPRDDLAKLARRLGLPTVWHDSEQGLQQRILAACQRAASEG